VRVTGRHSLEVVDVSSLPYRCGPEIPANERVSTLRLLLGQGTFMQFSRQNFRNFSFLPKILRCCTIPYHRAYSTVFYSALPLEPRPNNAVMHSLAPPAPRTVTRQ
jgi:hypothetical protein